jgi:DNA-binding transcriptional LysR family regulator
MRSIDISRLDLNLLVVFDAIYREKNVSWAARSLGKSQTNVSAALSRLRNVFQDPLFVRNGAGVKATDRAEELGPSICVALEQRLFSDEHVFAFRADHPEIGETIAPKELARLHVADLCMSSLTDQLTEKWRQQGVTADPVLRMSICMVAPFVAAQSDVVFLLPKREAEKFAQLVRLFPA